MRGRLLLRFLLSQSIWMLPLLTAFSCNKKHPPESAPSDDGNELKLSDAEFQLWLQRANNTLRLNQPMEDIPQSDNLGQLKLHEAARKISDDVAFYDMLTDFSTYWFGAKSQTFWERGRYDRLLSEQVAGQIPVINGVLAVANGGDYFTGLFTQQKQSYYYEFREPRLPESSSVSTNESIKQELLSRDEIRAKLLELMDREVDKLLAHVDDENKEAFCSILNDFPRSDSLINLRYRFGGPHEMFSDSAFDAIMPFFVWCSRPESPKPADARIMLSNIKLEFRKFYDDLKVVEAKFPGGHPLGVKHVTDLVPSDDAFRSARDAYGFNLFQALPNSSTNRNRKRASWVLKRFFCDDLTPLNVEIPSVHADDQHGSNPSCYSCHYKLDPMAGYFREIGAFGQSFAEEANIQFDDNASMDRTEYEKPWLAPDGSATKWNIGYIRSTTNRMLNTYGENLDDLLALLRTAPEVRECFVRRVFEYTVGEEQVADRLWLKSIADEMQETAKTSSQKAIKDVFVKMVTSRAFINTERSSGECYDLPPGVKREGRAPCRIAAIIERQCQSCHSGVSAQGGLDLSTWQKQADGGYGFNHKRDGGEVSRLDTFKSMRERLTTDDGDLRMPLMKTMPAQERQEIFQWLEKTIANF